MLVFAYGSNLSTTRMRLRCPSAIVCATGRVAQHEFAYHKRGIDGSAKADAAWTGRPEDAVYGVVYAIGSGERRLLDRYETLGVGYDRKVVSIAASNGRTWDAWMYVARQEAIDAGCLPFDWYTDFVESGAREHGLPAAYRRFLAAFARIVDPDWQRSSQHREILSVSVGEGASATLQTAPA